MFPFSRIHSFLLYMVDVKKYSTGKREKIQGLGKSPHGRNNIFHLPVVGRYVFLKI